MFFTIEDYKKIQEWLSRNSIKDTEFNEAMQPFKGNEIISFVQNGHNTKAYLKDFIDQLFLLGIPDFVNITEKFDESNISLSRAIQLIPYKSRKIGQVITFLNEEGVWKIYQFKGKRKNQWNEESLWIDLIKDIASKITTLADEEDITTVEENGTTVFKFKDKVYNPDNFSGKGRVYLRKNIVEVIDYNTKVKTTKNLLTQSMIGWENTIYIIQYDYDLNGQTITIPEGCILDFQGGSLNNGIVKGQNTGLNIYNNDNIGNIYLKGTWICDYVKIKWFGAKGDGITDDTDAIISALKSGCNVLLDNKIYAISNYNNIFYLNGQKLYAEQSATLKYIDHYIRSDIENAVWNSVFIIKGDNFILENITFDGGIDEWYPRPLDSTSDNWNIYLEKRNNALRNTSIKESTNFSIKNCTFINGSQSLNIENNSAFFEIIGCTFCKTLADSLYITNGANNGIIKDCYIYDNGDDGYCVNANAAEYKLSHNVTFINCSGKDVRGSLFISCGTYDVTCINLNGNCLRQAPIRVELIDPTTFNGNLGRINIIGCTIKSNKDGYISSVTSNYEETDSCIINLDGCRFYSDNPITHMIYRANNLNINNCLFENISLTIYYSNNVNINNCKINSSNNITIENCSNIRFINNKLNNLGLVNDKIKEQRKEEDTIYKRNINIKSSTVLLKNNDYYYKELKTYDNYYNISTDEFCNSVDNQYIEIDSSKLLTKNNTKLNIYYNGILNLSETNIFNKISIRNGQYVQNDLDDKYIRIISEGELYILSLKKSDYKYIGANSERPNFNDSEKDNYSNFIYFDNSLITPFIYNSIKNSWFPINISRPLYSTANNVYRGGKLSRPVLNNDDKSFNYYDITLNKPIWWNGAKWIDSNSNDADIKYSGTTAQRPTYINIGFQYFDTTLNKPIWWTGSQWVDATGASV